VEIKCRTSALYEQAPIHDKIQIHAYLFLTGLDEAVLMQCIQPEEGVFFAKETLVPFEPLFWQDIERRLVRCLALVQQLHQQPLARDCFVLLSDEARAEILKQNTD
jgi:hypothetical protein